MDANEADAVYSVVEKLHHKHDSVVQQQRNHCHVDEFQSALCQLSPELVQVVGQHLSPLDQRALGTTCQYLRSALNFAGHEKLAVQLPPARWTYLGAPALRHARSLQLHLDYVDGRNEGAFLRFAFLKLPQLEQLHTLDLQNLSFNTSELGRLVVFAFLMPQSLMCAARGYILNLYSLYTNLLVSNHQGLVS